MKSAARSTRFHCSLWFPQHSTLPRSCVDVMVHSHSVTSHPAQPSWVGRSGSKHPPLVQPAHQLLSNSVWVASTPNAVALGCTVSGVCMPGSGRIRGITCCASGLSQPSDTIRQNCRVYATCLARVTAASACVSNAPLHTRPEAPVRGTLDSTRGHRVGVSGGWRHSTGAWSVAQASLPRNSILLLVRSRFFTFYCAISGGVAEERARLLARARHRPERTMVLSPPTATAGTSLSHLPFERGLGGTGPGQ